MKRILKGKIFETRESLINELQKIWDLFPQEMIDKLCLSFQSRLRTLINQNGESISDLLRKKLEYQSPIVISSPNKLLQIDDLITNYDPTVNDLTPKFLSKRDFTTEEDILILTVTSSYPERIP